MINTITHVVELQKTLQNTNPGCVCVCVCAIYCFAETLLGDIKDVRVMKLIYIPLTTAGSNMVDMPH